MKHVCSAMWVTDGNIELFDSTAGVAKMLKALRPPAPFRNLVDGAGHKKRSVPCVESVDCVSASMELSSMLRETWIGRDRWVIIRMLLDNLVRSLSGYAQYLDTKKVRVQVHHARMESLSNNRTIQTFAVTVFLDPLMKTHSSEMESLRNAVSEVGDYCHINVLLHSPIDKVCQYRFYKQISLSHPHQLYCVTVTNPVPMAFIWSVPQQGIDQHYTTRTACIIADINDGIHEKHTRAMRQRHIDNFKAVNFKSRAQIVTFL
jgi:hypothetical protein